jgi:hypothetical protein
MGVCYPSLLAHLLPFIANVHYIGAKSIRLLGPALVTTADTTVATDTITIVSTLLYAIINCFVSALISAFVCTFSALSTTSTPSTPSTTSTTSTSGARIVVSTIVDVIRPRNWPCYDCDAPFSEQLCTTGDIDEIDYHGDIYAGAW